MDAAEFLANFIIHNYCHLQEELISSVNVALSAYDHYKIALEILETERKKEAA